MAALKLNLEQKQDQLHLEYESMHRMDKLKYQPFPKICLSNLY